MAHTWFDRRTHHGRQWDLGHLLEAKRAAEQRLSVVIPARNEAATIGDVVGRIHEVFVATSGLVDELVVIDGESTDDTARIAADAGATVHRLSEIRADLGTRTGKGEAMWKSQFVTTGDLVAFIDADLTEWDVHFVTALFGPLLTDPTVALVKGFYERPYRSGATDDPEGGGRVTELVARPLLAIARPELTQVVQPLAGEWAVRREVYETLHVPAGYGVELAALIDVVDTLGLDAIAQVDLGLRAHSHQSLLDLGPMAVQLMAAVLNRSRQSVGDGVTLRQFRAVHDGYAPKVHDVDVTERPPALQVAR